MQGPTIAQREKFASAEAGLQLDFLYKLEDSGPDPLMILAEEMTSTHSSEKHVFLGDVPQMEEWKADRRMATLMAHGFDITNQDWATGVVIHRNEILDDQLGKVTSRIAGLAQKASRHRGDLMMKSLINGFSGTAFPETGAGLAFDSALFFSASHTLEGGPSQSNTLGALALNDAGLEAADIRLSSFRTWDGKDPLDLNGTHLVVGPSLYPTAIKLTTNGLIINSAGTAASDNKYISGRYSVVRSPRLTGAYAGYWFLADLSKPTKPFIFQNREAITTAMQADWSSADFFKRGQINFGVQARYGLGAWDWRTIVGSTGV